MSKPFRGVVSNSMALCARATAARAACRVRREKYQRRDQLEKIIRDRLIQEVQRGSCTGCLDLLPGPDGHWDEGWDLCRTCYYGRAGAGKDYEFFCKVCHEADELDVKLMEALRPKLAAQELAAQNREQGFNATFRFAPANRPMNMARVLSLAAFM